MSIQEVRVSRVKGEGYISVSVVRAWASQWGDRGCWMGRMGGMFSSQRVLGDMVMDGVEAWKAGGMGGGLRLESYIFWVVTSFQGPGLFKSVEAAPEDYVVQLSDISEIYPSVSSTSCASWTTCSDGIENTRMYLIFIDEEGWWR